MLAWWPCHAQKRNKPRQNDADDACRVGHARQRSKPSPNDYDDDDGDDDACLLPVACAAMSKPRPNDTHWCWPGGNGKPETKQAKAT